MCLLTKPLRGTFLQNFRKCLKEQLKPSVMGPQTTYKMKIVQAPPHTAKTYECKNKDLKRVLSPHLTVYKPQLTSMMSISLRMTGFALGVLTWALGLTSLLSDHNVDYYVNKLQSLEVNDFCWTAAKIVVGFPFVFHFVAGVRHLFFDTAKLMEIKQFYRTGYMAIGLSCVLAVVLGIWETT